MKVRTKSKTLDIHFQQYQTGLYVCIYHEGRMVNQFGLDTTKEKFIEDLKSNPELEIVEELWDTVQ